MTSIIYIGMDVHTTNFTLCAYDVQSDVNFALVDVAPDYKNILTYLKKIENNRGEKCKFLCGYEAGCLGYSLYLDLKSHGVNCVIMAPTTIPSTSKEQKTDRRDAQKLSRCLAYNTYSAVHVPTDAENAIKEYIRMRDDVKLSLKRIKQQIIAFCIRNNKLYTGKSYWTKNHIAWLKSLDFNNSISNEAFHEYLALHQQLIEKINSYDNRITEICQLPEFKENVERISCFIGMKEYNSLATVVEIGDFKRFKTAEKFAAFLGLVPGEHSSGTNISRSNITKAGNKHIRTILIEAAQCFGRGILGYKSKSLISRQAKCDNKIVAYADKANERLKRRYKKLAHRINKNIVTVAIARELACFIWGIMTNNIS